MIKRFTALFLLPVIVFLMGCETKVQPADAPEPKEAAHELIYTKHARCRMDCRHVTETEVREIVAENHINERKSKPDDARCPTYAYEGYSHEQQHLRIVIAKCDEVWKVVTCIDLENEFACDCK